MCFFAYVISQKGSKLQGKKHAEHCLTHLNKTACEIWSVFDKVLFCVKYLTPFFHRTLQLYIRRQLHFWFLCVFLYNLHQMLTSTNYGKKQGKVPIRQTEGFGGKRELGILLKIELCQKHSRFRMQFCLGVLNNVVNVFSLKFASFLRYYVCEKNTFFQGYPLGTFCWMKNKRKLLFR